MKIPIIFLGTGQAIPTPKRNHTSILLKYKNENLLFDCGEGTQRQFRIAKQSLSKITRLLITHWHGDHILGIPGLLQTLQLSKSPHTLEVYGPKKTKQFMNNLIKLFAIKNLKIKVKELSGGLVFETKDFFVQALPMKHKSPCLAYSFIEKQRLRVDKRKISKYKIPGKLIGKLASGKNIKHKGKTIKSSQVTYKEPGKKITIIMDTLINPNTYKIAKNSDLLISEATYSESEASLAHEYKHLTASQAARIAKKAKVKKLILTHLSQRYEHKDIPIFNEARKIFKNTGVAEDFDIVEV
tara:strand:+ start:157 stop:1050 length:894 start_codon:yes stop_codon:yes gene_type:complete